MTGGPRFDLDRELGSGTTGVVWHGALREPYEGLPAGFELAVKYLHPALEKDARARERFDTEAEAGSAVRGRAGIVHVLHAGRDARGRHLVMPFVPGHTLRAVLEASGPLPEPLWRAVARQIAAGLAALHEEGFVHGDVKPENMRLDAEGRAVLLDLGFARRAEPGSHGDGAARAVAPKPGSLAYLAPEQARGEAGGPASDVFALGVVLYELATGWHPFARRASGASSGAVPRQAIDRPDADALLAAIAAPRFGAPSRLVPQLSPFLDRILEDVLQRDPELRPASRELERRLVEQESGEWWRSQIDFAAGARRSSVGERDAPHLTPLVGREPEMARLSAMFARAARPGDPGSAGGGAVWLSGAAGSGKSRLVHELASRVRTSSDPPLYLYGRCHRLEEERPGEAVLGLLQRYLRLPPGVAAGKRERAELEELVGPAVARTLEAALDPSFDGATAQPPPVALAEWLAALGRRMPVLVFLDDLTWAGGETLRTLALLAERLAGTRLLFVLGLRPDAEPREKEALAHARERFAEHVPTIDVELAPLGEPAVFDLVRRMFHRSAPRIRLARVLWERSRGNAGLLAELLRGMMARGDAYASPRGGLLLRIAPDDLPLPRSLPKAIAESYRGLPAEDRLWLRRLAVVGGRIETDFLVQAFPPSKRGEVDEVLARLARMHWLVPAGPRYRFARPALREAVYSTLSKDQRRRLHEFAARALAAPGGERASLETEFQRAFHLRAAGMHGELLGLLEPLIERLLGAGQPQRVHALSLWGLEAVDALPPSDEQTRRRIRFLETALDAADRLGYREGQRELLDRLSDIDIDPDHDPVSAGRVYLLHGRYALSTGQYGLARGMLRNAVLLFRRTRSMLELSESLRRLSAVQGHVGELREARRLARQAIETAQHDPQRAVAHLALGVIDVLEDAVEDALEETERALRLLRGASDWNLPGVIGAALNLRVRVYRIAGRLTRALASAQRAVRLAQRAGERRLEAEALARAGGILVELDRAEEAEVRLREALRIAEEIEDRRGRALATLFLGELLAGSGDPEASDLLARAGSLAEEMGLNRIEALASSIRARIARAGGDLEGALELSAHATELLEQYGAELADRIVIVATHAALLRQSGERAAAARLEKAMRSRLERENARIRSPRLRQDHSQNAERLLAAALAPEGPAYPRLGERDREPAP